MFVDPTFRDLFQRRGIEIVQLFSTPPKRNNQVRFNQQTKMFGNALARHPEMPAKLIQSLAIVEMELVEERAPVWVGQGFEDIVHVEANMQPKGCIFVSPCNRWLNVRAWRPAPIQRPGAISFLDKACGSRSR